MAAAAALVWACGGEPEVEHEPIDGCCAFDSPLEVLVLDDREAPVEGVAVSVSTAAGDGTWPLVTDAGGRASVDPGVLGTFVVTLTARWGYELAAGQAAADTVTTTPDSGATVTFRLVRAP